MSLTKSVQERAAAALPYEELLPYEQPSYVHSYVYLFGIATVVSFILLILSGFVLSAFGPQWWHSSTTGSGSSAAPAPTIGRGRRGAGRPELPPRPL